jgi:hypothetical protein
MKAPKLPEKVFVRLEGEDLIAGTNLFKLVNDEGDTDCVGIYKLEKVVKARKCVQTNPFK